MFRFLGMANILSAMLTFCKLIDMYKESKNSYYVNEYIPFAWFILISSIINAIMFFKLHKMEKRTLWLTDIANKSINQEESTKDGN